MAAVAMTDQTFKKVTSTYSRPLQSTCEETQGLRSSLRLKQSKAKTNKRAVPENSKTEDSDAPSDTHKPKRTKEDKPNTKRLPCDKCGEMFKASALQSHIQRHLTEKEYQCDSCEKAFVCVLAYHRHGSRIHNKDLVCEKCDKRFKKTDYFIRHLKFGHAEKTYTCVLCSFATPESNQLRMHMEKRHLKNYSLFCNVCSKGFFDRSSLKEHENMHTGVTPYQCEVCGMSFKIKSTLRAHKFKFHPNLFPHVCEVCGKGLSTKEGLESHLKLHAENRKFICDICGRNLNTPRSLLEHRRLHTGERPFECGLCLKNYPAQKHLIRHVKLVHTGEKPDKKHECRHCNKKYASLSACLSHQKVCSVAAGNQLQKKRPSARKTNTSGHHTKTSSSSTFTSSRTKDRLQKNNQRYPCSKCGEKYNETKMASHLKDHDSKVSYPCDFCDKIFISIWACYRHGYKFHEKKLECDKCHKQFQDIKRFTWHLRYMHAEKSYSCTKCSYATSMRAKLKRHIDQTHAKQYVAYCDICSKGFVDKSYLVEHRNLHSGNTPNQCELCGKSFRLKTTLRAHRFKFHADHFQNICGLCKKGFATKSGLESHYLAHKENRQFICDFCGKHLTTAATLREHRRMHTGEHPFKCDLCGKEFRAKKHLGRHVSSHYESKVEKKNHECHYCSKMFFDSSACMLHTQKCHVIS